MITAKFRIWCPEEKEMYYDCLVGSDKAIATYKLASDGFGDIDEISYAQWEFEGKPTDFIVAQFSGAKDIDGKDIYAGDLFYLDGVLHKVFFNESTFSFDVHNFSSQEAEALYDYVAAGIEIKIIGNEFQNPELLKALEK